MKPSHETLRDLYESQGMTTRQIGERLGVSKTQVVRWMKSYGMVRRPVGRGLEARGFQQPTPAELEWMVHVEHLGYREIASRYGVDQTAVSHWLDKHGIARPTIWGTRRKGVTPPPLDAENVRARYESGESISSIASSCNSSRQLVRAALVAGGIEVRRDGWNGGHRYQCLDGHLARSIYEQKVDDWLHEHGVEHELEPAYPWDRRYRADFKVGDTYIEVWGVTENEDYQKRKAMKVRRCKEDGLDLIGINYGQFFRGRKFWKALRRLTPTPTLPAPLFPLAPAQTSPSTDLETVP